MQEDELRPVEWEIWHTYSTYLDNPDINLLRAAKSLVSSGVATCVISYDDKVFWNDGNALTQATLVLGERDEEGIAFHCRTEQGKRLLPSGFALEAVGQAVQLRIAEQRILGESLAFADAHVRAFLGKIVIGVQDGGQLTGDLNLYPTLLIYQSGVIILELRMIGPSGPIALADFVNNAVNLSKVPLATTKVNPGLARMATEAYYRSSYVPFLARFRYSSSQRLHNQAIEQITTQELDDEHLAFDLSPWSGETEFLQDIVMTIFQTTAYVITSPRQGLAFYLLGAKKPPVIGAFWSGRPHVHLIRFEGQKETAKENQVVHADSFHAILARTKGMSQPLPPDLRLFEDYNAFVTASASLWAWSKGGYEEQFSASDVNRTSYVFDRQILAELVEYGYMLHRGFYHRVQELSSTEQVMAVRRVVLELRLRMREASHAGEIRNLLEEGWRALGLPALIQDINAGLALREADVRSADTSRATRVGWAITIVFGIVAVPPLADQVVTPAWHLLHLPSGFDENRFRLMTVGISIALIIVVLSGLLLLLSRRRR